MNKMNKHKRVVYYNANTIGMHANNLLFYYIMWDEIMYNLCGVPHYYWILRLLTRSLLIIVKYLFDLFSEETKFNN